MKTNIYQLILSEITTKVAEMADKVSYDHDKLRIYMEILLMIALVQRDYLSNNTEVSEDD